MAPIFESEPIKPLPDVILRDRVPRRFESAAGFEPRRFVLKKGVPSDTERRGREALRRRTLRRATSEWCDLDVFLLSWFPLPYVYLTNEHPTAQRDAVSA